MTTRRRIAGTIAATAVLAGLLATAPNSRADEADDVVFDCNADLGDPAPGTPEWNDAYANTRWCSTRKPPLILSNPAYAAAKTANAAAGGETGGDPFREPSRWHGVRGDYLQVTWKDHAGVEHPAELLSPLEADVSSPLPGVVLVCHAGCSTISSFSLWHWAAQALAERGYVVMYPDVNGNNIDNTIAATDYFVSDANPWRARLDATRLGIVGHSGAAGVSLNVGNTDGRFDAIVAWDPAGPGIDDLELRTPTMLQVRDLTEGDEAGVTPPASKPAPTTGRYTYFDKFREAGVDVMQVAVRSSVHTDWLGADCASSANPFGPTGPSCSVYGEQVAAYYTLAWFDRYLRGQAPAGPAAPPGDRRNRRGIAADALGRLTATGTFDNSSDAHSIGIGFFDEQQATATGSIEKGNRPITIEGLRIRNRLSFWYPTRYFLNGGDVQCADLRAGCPPG